MDALAQARRMAAATRVPINPPPIEAYSEVKRHFTLPFDLYGFQIDTVNKLAQLPRAGYYLDVGIGKTATSTASVLWKFLHGADQCVVLMPPILIKGWHKWLSGIPEVTSLMYKGTPSERAAMSLDADFILMSYQIFKRDYDRISREIGHKRIVMILDEATAIKNVGSDNHKKIRDFNPDTEMLLLTGTPLSTPADAYAYVKLVAPSVYRNIRQFENIHVKDRDFFGNITEWGNLDVLRQSMSINSVRILKEDVIKDLPEVTYVPVYYDLDSAHQRLYQQLADEQLLKLPDGGKIDATQATALFHALQQIVVNFGHFSGDDENVAAGIELIQETLDELGDAKLLVFANYRLTNRLIAEHFDCPAVYGDVSPAKQSANVERFLTDPKCRMLTAQPLSLGYGYDGIQKVCQNLLFIEEPIVPKDFHQSVARINRIGQQFPMTVRVAIAENTIQPYLHKRLMSKDDLVGAVVRNAVALRSAIHGT